MALSLTLSNDSLVCFYAVVHFFTIIRNITSNQSIQSPLVNPFRPTTYKLRLLARSNQEAPWFKREHSVSEVNHQIKIWKNRNSSRLRHHYWTKSAVRDHLRFVGTGKIIQREQTITSIRDEPVASAHDRNLLPHPPSSGKKIFYWFFSS